uniref:Uncharacterized protein n=1 Tax=Anguilla anguilla TaxID=7936 RepID=A0A0E9XFY6_ANGAN
MMLLSVSFKCRANRSLESGAVHQDLGWYSLQRTYFLTSVPDIYVNKDKQTYRQDNAGLSTVVSQIVRHLVLCEGIHIQTKGNFIHSVL